MIDKRQFLLDNKPLILRGLQYIDYELKEPTLLMSLNKLGWNATIVADSQWNPYKAGETETSEEDREVRIKFSYYRMNSNFFNFSDAIGWSWHELVHAIIFNGSMPKEFMSISSPFCYPLNTDEIYCFGWQIRQMLKDGTFGNLVAWYESHPGHEAVLADILLLKDCLF